MGAIRLAVHTSFHYEGREYRLMRLLDGGVWQAEDVRTRRILEIPHEELLARYAQREVIFSAPHQLDRKCSPARNPMALALSASQVREATRRKRYVLASLKLPCSRTSALRAAIDRVRDTESAGRSPSFATVFRWRRDFLTSGRDIRSLVPKTHDRGRRRVALAIEVEDIIEQAIDEHFLTLQRKTINDTWDATRAAVATLNATRSRSESLPIPTLHQIRSRIREIPAYDRCLARYGYVTARARFRAVLGSNSIDTPLDTAQADHTQLNLLVIDDQSGMPLGRPWLTVILDGATRCVLGLHVSFTPPSYLTVARAMLHAFTPKLDLSLRYPVVKGQWPAHGIMSHLVVDNGAEFHSDALEQLAGELGIEIIYCPRKAAWYKGRIERFLGTLNRDTAHIAPGTTFGSILERGEYDPKKHAVVAFSTLMLVIVKWIVDVYHERPHRGLAKRCPRDVWESAIQPDLIRYADDLTRLEALIGRPYNRRLTHKGVELFGGLFWNTEELRQWRCVAGENLTVDVLVNEADLGQVVVTDGRDHVYTVRSTRPDYAMGLSVYQHQICRRFAERHLENRDSVDAWVLAKAEIVALIKSETERRSSRRTTHTRAARFMQVSSDARAQDQASQPRLKAPSSCASLPPPETIVSSARPRFRAIVAE